MHFKTQSNFSTEEDRLLCMGARAFGFADPSSIRAHCLPTKSVAQVEARMRNLIRRGAETSEIKRLYLQPFKPLILVDRELLLDVGGYGSALGMGCRLKLTPPPLPTR